MHPSTLLLAFPDNTIQIYDVETRQFPSWGKELISSLPKRFTHAHDPILGVAFDPASSSHSESTKTRFILFWGATWLFKAALDTSVRVAGKKRRREVMDGAAAAAAAAASEERPWRDDKLIMQYRPIACCDFLTKDELVVVERPLVDILATLPPAYFKHKYGAS
jgi:U3 small nucleolar RNA-associated protein 4